MVRIQGPSFVQAEEHFLRNATDAQKAETYLSLLRMGVLFENLHDDRDRLLEALVYRLGRENVRRLVKEPRPFNEALVRIRVDQYGLSEAEVEEQLLLNIANLLITVEARRKLSDPSLIKITRWEKRRIQRRILKGLRN